MRMGSVRKLSEEEIQERLASYAKHPEPNIRDEIVLQYANLVESIGRRFVGACEPIEDLVQEGYLGLIASVDKYDGDKGVKFSTYATHFIVGQIKHYLRDKGKIIKEPAWLQELNQRMTKVIDSLNQQLGRQPNEKEIAEVMQMSEQTVREMLTTREVFKVSSLDNTDNDDSSRTRDSEKIKDEKLISFQLPLEDKIVLEAALDRLKDIEQQVIADHFYKGLNQTEIAKNLSISCNYVSHILRNGTKKLKKILVTDEIRDTQMQRSLISKRVTNDEPDHTTSVLDPTTGVYNRKYFVERLNEEISRACRDNYKLAVMFLEVNLPDDVEALVRMIRHDDILYTVAQSLRKSIRRMDVLARYGENTFAVLLPHTSNQAGVVAERLTMLVSELRIESGQKGKKLSVNAKIGLSRYPVDAAAYREVLQIAAVNLGTTLENLESDAGEELRKAA